MTSNNSNETWQSKANSVVRKNNLRVILIASIAYLLLSFLDVKAFPDVWPLLLLAKGINLAIVLFLFLLHYKQKINVFWFSGFTGAILVSHNGFAIAYAELDNILPISLKIFGFLLISSLIIYLRRPQALTVIFASMVSVALGLFFAENITFEDWVNSSGPVILLGIVISFFLFEYRMRNILNQSKIQFELEESKRLLNNQNSNLEKLAQELESSNEELEQKVAFRSESLLKANQERDEMIYRLSHDFKTPMINVRSMLTMAQHTKDSVQLQEIHRRMDENLDRFEALVNDMESFVAYSNGLIEMNQFDLNALIQDIWGRLPSAQKGKMSLICSSDIPSDVYSDPTKIDLALSTVISNAAQYQQKEGENLLEISGYWSGDEVVLSLKDNGDGIPKEVLSRVFDLFYRGTARSKGLGIGLYLSKNTLEQLGGSIEVTSPGIGKGTTVTVSFPG